jgi:hypothetical protein
MMSAGEMMNGGEDAGSDMAGEDAGTESMGGNDNPLGAQPCCDGRGSCVQSEIMPDEVQEILGECNSPSDDDLVCVPNEFLDLSWTPTPCQGYIFFFNPYNGVCLPECLEIPFEWSFDERPCPENFVCSPCRTPDGNPTGAPGCEP